MRPAIALLGALLLFCGLCQAETVKVPVGQQSADSHITTPKPGITKAQVADQFGSPLAKSGPVGEPPIYQWEYRDFIVYFEGKRVIHTVLKDKNEMAHAQDSQ